MQQTSGQYGCAFNASDPIGTLADWTVNAISETQVFVASNTHGGTGRRQGNEDWNGTCKQYVAWPDALDMMPAGDAWSFIGFMCPRDGIPSHVGPAIGGLVLTESVTMTIDWAGSAIVEWMTNFVGNGELHWDAEDTSLPSVPTPGVRDTTFPKAIPSKFITVGIAEFSASPVYNPICTLKSVLNFKANVYPFSSSCTGGFVNRVTGTKDWTLTITMDDPDMNNLVNDLDQNQFIGIRFVYSIPGMPGVVPLTLQWGLVKDINNINVNIETGDMISYDVVIDMSVDTGPNTGIANSIVSFPKTEVGTVVETWWPLY